MTAEEIRQAYQALGKDHPAIKALLYQYQQYIDEIIIILANSSTLDESKIRHLCGELSFEIEMRDFVKEAVGIQN